VAEPREPLRRIRKARRLSPSPLSRKDVTRGEYNRIIDILNERAVILNDFRDAINELKRANDVQFKRVAQVQADLDVIKQAWNRIKVLV